MTIITFYMTSVHWFCRTFYNSLNCKDHFDLWYDGSMTSCSPPKVSEKSADHKKMPQLLHATVLQAQYLHWPDEDMQHTNAISCPTWLGPRLSWMALWRRLLRSSRATGLSASRQPRELQNSPTRRPKTTLFNNKSAKWYPHPRSKWKAICYGGIW